MPRSATNASIGVCRILDVEPRARTLARLRYSVAAALPAHDRHGLRSEMNGSAVSLPSNIAEGYGRRHT